MPVRPNQNAVTFHGRSYTLDRHGFLDPPEQWDENFARGMAEKTGIYDGLTDEHWEFIRYLRRKFLDERSVPVVVLACADNHIRLNKLRSLFPAGYHRGACKIAGINYAFMYQHNIWLTYESTSVLKAEHELDPMGFLLEFEKWNERFARVIVDEWNLPGGMTERHLEIIRFLQDYYRVNRLVPPIFETCRATSMTLEELRTLFPDGYRRGACRAAGLPFFG